MRSGLAAIAESEAQEFAQAPAPVLTYFGINSYSLEIGGQRLLVDPILKGDLVFLDQAWAFSGTRCPDAPLVSIEPRHVPELFDAIVLSQGLEDHAHPATLREIPRGVHIVASPRAAAVARRLGFVDVDTLAPGEALDLGASLRINALPGSVVGPPWDDPENGYVFQDLRPGGLSVGAEPHGNFLGPAVGTSLRMLPRAPDLRVDALLTPLRAQDLAGYRLVNGPLEAVRTLEALRPVPRIVLPLKNGDIQSEGLLASALREHGSPREFADLLRARPRLRDRVRVLDVVPGQPVRIE